MKLYISMYISIYIYIYKFFCIYSKTQVAWCAILSIISWAEIYSIEKEKKLLKICLKFVSRI